MKNFTVLIILSFLISNLYSQTKDQKFSIIIGANLILAENSFNEYSTSPDLNLKPGIAVGLSFSKKINSSLNISTEVLLKQDRIDLNNYSYSIADYNWSSGEPEKIIVFDVSGNRRMNYFQLSIPILLEIKPLKNKNLSFNIGLGFRSILFSINDNLAKHQNVQYYEGVTGIPTDPTDLFRHNYVKLAEPRVYDSENGTEIKAGGKNFFGEGIAGIIYSLPQDWHGFQNFELRFRRKLVNLGTKLYRGTYTYGSVEFLIRYRI